MTAIDVVLTPPRWWTLGACHGEPVAVFFPNRYESNEAAFSLCQCCEVRETCLAEALAEEGKYGFSYSDGIRGGRTANERREMIRAARMADG